MAKGLATALLLALLVQLAVARKSPSNPFDAWVGAYEGACVAFSNGAACTKHIISTPVVVTIDKGGLYSFYNPKTTATWSDGSSLTFPEYMIPVKAALTVQNKAAEGWLCVNWKNRAHSASTLVRFCKIDGADIYEEYGISNYTPGVHVLSECPAPSPFRLECSPDGWYYYKCIAFKVK